MNGDDSKLKFLRREFFTLAWGASVQHNPTYIESAIKVEIDKFRDAMFLYLADRIEPRYQQKVAEDQHFSNLEALMEYAAGIGGNVLKDRRYKSANAQKLLNLYLKYLWCAGLVETPPHCPIDRIVLSIKRLPGNWTEMVTIEDYREKVSQLQELVGGALATWELESYSRR